MESRNGSFMSSGKMILSNAKLQTAIVCHSNDSINNLVSCVRISAIAYARMRYVCARRHDGRMPTASHLCTLAYIINMNE